MARGLFASLSPNEEIALRRIATGLLGARVLQRSSVTQLKALGLITEHDDFLSLTADGVQRVSTLPNRNLRAAPLNLSDEHVATLAKELDIRS